MGTRGMGRVYQPKYRDRTTGEWRISPTWWIAYSYRGRKIRESSTSSRERAEVKLLKKRLGEMGQGQLVGPDAEKVTFEHLAEGLRNDYRNNGRKSLKRANEAIARLADTFGMHRAMDMTSDRVVAYQTARLNGGAAPATVHYECAVLKRMFTLAVRAGRLVIRPYIPSLDVSNNVRTGFFERDTFEAVLAHLPDDEQAVPTSPISPAGVCPRRS